MILTNTDELDVKGLIIKGYRWVNHGPSSSIESHGIHIMVPWGDATESLLIDAFDYIEEWHDMNSTSFPGLPVYFKVIPIYSVDVEYPTAHPEFFVISGVNLI